MNVVFQGFPARQSDDSRNGFIDLQALLSHGLLPNQGVRPVDNFTNTHAVHYSSVYCLFRPLNIWLLATEEALSGLGVQKRGRDRLLDLMRNGRRELAQCRQPISMGQFHLHVAESPLALTRFCFCPPALG